MERGDILQPISQSELERETRNDKKIILSNNLCRSSKNNKIYSSHNVSSYSPCADELCMLLFGLHAPNVSILLPYNKMQ